MVSPAGYGRVKDTDIPCPQSSLTDILMAGENGNKTRLEPLASFDMPPVRGRTDLSAEYP
jgi:hypothetical protein